MQASMKSIASFFVAIFIVGTNLPVSKAQDDIASRIIEKAESASKSVLGNAENSGDTLLVRSADQLNLSASNIKRILGDEIDKSINRLSEEKRQLLVDLDEKTDRLERGIVDFQSISDTASLDLRSILGDSWFSKNRLVMQRMRGLTQVQGATRPIILTGSYIGTSGSDHKSEVTVSVQGKIIHTQNSPQSLHELRIGIAPEILQAYFLSNVESFVPIKFHVNQEFRKCKLFVFCAWESRSYDVGAHLILFPKYAGDIKVSVQSRKYGWKNTGNLIARRTGGSNHCESGCRGHQGTTYGVSVDVSGGVKSNQISGDQKIIQVISCKCVSGECGYDVFNGTSINSRATSASCNWSGRSHPSTWEIVAKIQTWGVIDAPVTYSEHALRFGELTEIKTPEYSTTVRITGELLTGGKIDLLASQNDANPYIEIVRRAPSPNGELIFVRPKFPADL